MKRDSHILIVDDEPPNLLILEDLLDQHYVVHALNNGKEALDYLTAAGQADLVLLDVLMPEMDGFQACRRIKAEPRLRDIPVLFLTSLAGEAEEALGLSIGAEDFIHKPFSRAIVLARVRSHLELALARRRLRDRNAELEQLVEARARDLLHEKHLVIAAQESVITALCSLAEIRDNETGNHIRRTQNYVKALAEHLRDDPRFAAELNDVTIRLLFMSAPLHDIGKVAIPDAILQKPGKLTAEEWQSMKQHPAHGRDAIIQAESEIGESAAFLRHAREIAYGHHEKWDCSGYPQGLAGTHIPLSARIMAVADVYDALISKRVYKKGFSHAEAVAIIAGERGSHFDPYITDGFLEISGDFELIAKSYSDALTKPPPDISPPERLMQNSPKPPATGQQKAVPS